MSSSSRKRGALCKVTFNLDPDAWHGHGSETVWAEAIAGDRYRLRNVPFYAKGVGVEDIVNVREESSSLLFESVSISAGHSTYRIIIDQSKSKDVFEDYWAPLESLGCTYESAKSGIKLLAVDVPSAADVYEVYSLFERGEKDGIWDFEEGHCGHLVRDAKGDAK